MTLYDSALPYDAFGLLYDGGLDDTSLTADTATTGNASLSSATPTATLTTAVTGAAEVSDVGL